MGRKPVLRSNYKKLIEIAGIIYRNFRLPGIVHYQFITEGKPVNKEMYTDIIRRLTDAVSKQHPADWRNMFVFFHDNAPAHRSVLNKDFLTKNKVTTLEHRPYSPGLSPAPAICFLHCDQHCNDGALMILLTSIRMQGRAEKAITKWLPGLFSTPLQSL
jgi:hypothetical protein